MSDEQGKRSVPPPPPPQAPLDQDPGTDAAPLGRPSHAGDPHGGPEHVGLEEPDAYDDLDDWDHDEPVDYEEPRKRTGCLVISLLLLLILVAVPLTGFFFLRAQGVLGSSEPGAEVTFEIPRGSTSQQIAQILVDNDVIDSVLGFRIANYLDGGVENVLAGEYTLPTNLTARDALAQLLERGPRGEEFVPVTFPEGSWLEDIARQLGRDTHIDADRFLEITSSAEIRPGFLQDDVTTLEGLLFPSTYQVVSSDNPRKVAQRMLNEMEKRVSELDFSAVEAMGLSVYDAINVASMVEAEAKTDADRAKIARTIYNRIDQGMRLDIDATVLYALGEHKPSLTQSDLQVDSPYNTRLYAGMPPTPIGAPGQKSLEAAADPAEGPWLFYVLQDCETGEHAFSESYEEFLRNKAAYQALGC